MGRQAAGRRGAGRACYDATAHPAPKHRDGTCCPGRHAGRQRHARAVSRIWRLRQASAAPLGVSLDPEVVEASMTVTCPHCGKVAPE